MFSWLSSLFGSSSEPSPEEMAAAKTTVEKLIASYPIAVFSKSYCPYCSRAKSTLRSSFSDNDIGILELDQIDNGDAIQSAIAKQQRTSRVTVPQIYIKGKLIGGNSDLQSLVAKSTQWEATKKSVKNTDKDGNTDTT